MENSKNYKIKFAQLIEGLRCAYPRYNFLDDDYSKKFWFKNLSDIDIGRLTVAVESFISTSKWPPTIAELREMALKTEQEEINWGFGWDLVNKAIGKFGQYQETKALEWIRENDRIASTTIARIGFKDLCNSSKNEKGYFRNTFEKIYNDLKNEQKFKNQLQPDTRSKLEEMQGEYNKMLNNLENKLELETSLENVKKINQEY